MCAHGYRCIGHSEVTGNNGKGTACREVERASLHKGSTRVGVRSEGRTQAEGSTTVGDQGCRSSDRWIHDQSLLVDVEVEVRASAGERVGSVSRGERSVEASVRDDTHAKCGGCCRREGDRLGSTWDEAPGVCDDGSGCKSSGSRSVTVVTRRYGSSAYVRAGEGRRSKAAVGVTHGHDTEGVVISGEGAAICYGPTADKAIHQIRRSEVGAIDLRQEDIAVRVQTLATQRVIAVGAIVIRVAVEVHAAVVGRITDEVTNGQLNRAAFIDVRKCLDGVLTTGDSYGVERHNCVCGASTVDGDTAALKSNRIGGSYTSHVWRAIRIEAEVIPVQCAVVQREASGAGDAAGVTELQGAATDDSRTRVGVGIREQCRIIASASECEGTSDRAAKGAATDGGYCRCSTSIGKRATLARKWVNGGQSVDGLVLAIKVEQSASSVKAD